jgi:hypothetical protein
MGRPRGWQAHRAHPAFAPGWHVLLLSIAAWLSVLALLAAPAVQMMTAKMGERDSTEEIMKVRRSTKPLSGPPPALVLLGVLPSPSWTPPHRLAPLVGRTPCACAPPPTHTQMQPSPAGLPPV